MSKGNSIDLDCYIAEIVHCLKIAEPFVVPSISARRNTQKKGWLDPLLKEAKIQHRFWYHVWLECDRPSFVVVFELNNLQNWHSVRLLENEKNNKYMIYLILSEIILSFYGNKFLNLLVRNLLNLNGLILLNGMLICRRFFYQQTSHL
jgi:hypothetical protein